jgi:toxin FitB
LTRFLLDTNVVSELAPGKRLASPGLLDWLARQEDNLFLSVVTVTEIRSGVLKLGRVSPGPRHRAIAAWAEELEVDFVDRLLPMTRQVAAQAAVVSDRNVAGGSQPGWPDIVIEATAAVHGMALLTRNLRHFLAAGIPVLDPFATPAGELP